MRENLKKALETMPDELATQFFALVNDLLKDVEGELNPLETAEVMLQSVGSILATYLINLVDPNLREYVAAKMLFNLSASLSALIETSEDTKTPTPTVDINDSI